MIYVFCDGGARGNPGPAAFGFVVKQGNQTLHKEGGYLGVATNNYAEYTAIIKALKWLQKRKKAEGLAFFLDSKLAASQLSGIYKIKNANIRNMIVEIRMLENEFKSVSYTHIPREQNTEADAMVNQALDNQWI